MKILRLILSHADFNAAVFFASVFVNLHLFYDTLTTASMIAPVLAQKYETRVEVVVQRHTVASKLNVV
jgi:hypothetical protein